MNVIVSNLATHYGFISPCTVYGVVRTFLVRTPIKVYWSHAMVTYIGHIHRGKLKNIFVCITIKTN